MEKRRLEQTKRLKKMGGTLIGLAIFFSAIAYFSPRDETNYWLSSEGKEGFYVLSAFFVFLGVYCFGAIWRRSHFL